MPFYRPIKGIKPKKTRLRMLAGLKALRMQMDEEMPHKTKDTTLILEKGIKVYRMDLGKIA